MILLGCWILIRIFQGQGLSGICGDCVHCLLVSVGFSDVCLVFIYIDKPLDTFWWRRGQLHSRLPVIRAHISGKALEALPGDPGLLVLLAFICINQK